MVILTPQILTDIKGTAQVLVQVTDGTEKPILGCFMGEETTREGARLLRKHGVPNYRSPDRAVAALDAMWRYRVYREREEPELKRFDVDQGKVQQALEEACEPGEAVMLVEVEARDVVSAYGIPIPEARLARTSGEAVDIAEEIGFPVVLKIASPDILHKSDVGGIEVGLGDPDEVRQAYDRVMSRARQHAPDGEIWGVLVQEMVDEGKEIIVGMNRDSQFGPLMMFGLGGIYVEVLEDVTFRLAPVAAAEAEAMIEEIEASPLLHGARGEQAVDLEAIVEILERASQLALDFPEITALDLNPVVAQPEGALAIDARLSIEKRAEC